MALSDISLPYQLLFAFALGNSAEPALVPLVQSISNETWALHAVKPPPAVLLSQGVAQGQVDPGWAAARAAEQGFDQTRFDAMVNVANVGMPLGSAYQAWRRGNLSDAGFATQLKRLGIEEQWYAALEALKTDRLDLGALATAVHRGIMADDGLLVTPVPSGPGNVPRIPQSSLDTLAEFAAQGIDPERARVLVADTGLPLALGEMLQLLNRNVVTETDVKVSIAESNVRNEYMDVALALARRLLTPHEYAEAELRGVMSHPDAVAGASLSGLNGADYATLFAILGRPLSEHQVTTGLARGGTYGGDYTDVPAGPYRDAIRRSAIRPEYASLAYANRYTYPTGFQIKSEAADLGYDQTHQLLLEVGWAPQWADVFAAKWSGAASGTATDQHVTKAATQLWTTTHSSYKSAEIGKTTAQQNLTTLGVDAASQTQIFTYWDAERATTRKQLSPTQIRKAVSGGVTNPLTGVPWTRQDALTELMDRGYSQADAETFLDE